MKKKDFIPTLLFAIIVFIAFTFLWNYKTTVPWIIGKATAALGPLLGGLGIGFALNIPASFIEKRLVKHGGMTARHSRGISILISLLFLTALLAFVITLVLPELVNAVSIFVSSLRSFAANSDFWNNIDVRSIPVINSLFDSADDTILTAADAIEDKLDEWTPSIISFTVSTLRSFIAYSAAFIIAFIFAIYSVANKEMLKRHITKFLALVTKEGTLTWLMHIAEVSYRAFSLFIIAQVTEAVIIGLLCFTGMIIFRFPYAPVIGALTGVTALIPIYGAVIGALIGAFMIAVVNPWQGLFFLLFLIVLQQLEGNLIYPKVVGTTTGVPSVYVFAAVTIGGALFGIMGMLLAVPVFSVIFTILKELYGRKCEEQQAS